MEKPRNREITVPTHGYRAGKLGFETMWWLQSPCSEPLCHRLLIFPLLISEKSSLFSKAMDAALFTEYSLSKGAQSRGLRDWSEPSSILQNVFCNHPEAEDFFSNLDYGTVWDSRISLWCSLLHLHPKSHLLLSLPTPYSFNDFSSMGKNLMWWMTWNLLFNIYSLSA